uniref:Uncharacterized protein n=1 Tax=Anguilla anguilla TaxID=7936 RepID=A0A0E9SG53_ANGAN
MKDTSTRGQMVSEGEIGMTMRASGEMSFESVSKRNYSLSRLLKKPGKNLTQYHA